MRVDFENVLRLSRAKVSAIPQSVPYRAPSVPDLQRGLKGAKSKQQALDALFGYISAQGGLSNFRAGECKYVDEWRAARLDLMTALSQQAGEYDQQSSHKPC